MTVTREARAFDVADPALAAEGVRRIEWAEREMPVLRLIRERFEKEQPLKGMRIGACLHVTSRDGQPDAYAGRWWRDGALCARPTRCRRKTTSLLRCRPSTACRLSRAGVSIATATTTT